MEQQRREELLNAPTKSLLLKFSFPAIVGMIINSLYQLVDSIFVSKGAGVDAFNGLVIALPAYMIVFAFALAIGIGASSVISRALGAGDEEKLINTVEVTYILVIVLGVLTFFAGLFFSEEIAILFSAKGSQIQYAASYIKVTFMLGFFNLFVVSVNNLFRSVGNFKLPMLTMVIGIVVNIILDPIFIYESINIFGNEIKLLNLGVAGAALASEIGFIVSFIFIFLFGYTHEPKLRHFSLKPNLAPLKEIVTLGSSTFVRNVTASVAVLVLNFALNKHGDDYITISGIIGRLTMFLFMPSFGLIQGMGPIVGANYGAKKFDRVKEVSYYTIKITTIYFTVGYIVMFFFSDFLFKIFLAGSDVDNIDFILSEGKTFIRVSFFIIPVLAIQVVMSTLLQSIGFAKKSFILNLIYNVTIIPAIFIFDHFWGVTGIMFTRPFAYTVAILLALKYFYEVKRKLNF